MKKLLIRSAAIVFLCASLCGCSTILVLTVSGQLQQPVITPERRAGPVYLSNLTIYRGPDSGSEDLVVWKIEGRDGECVRFTRLVYGQTPEGFLEIIPALALEAGVVYSARARGDIRGPLGAIWVGGGSYIFSEDAWRHNPP